LTEVPEHLLRRSQERRAALGLGGGADAAPAASTGDASTAVAPASGSSPARTAAVPVVDAGPRPPAFVPPYVRASESRSRVPIWVMPVLAFLPVWAVIYAQSLSAAPSRELTQLAAGSAIFNGTGACAGCHGGTGGGGTGRKLNDGEVLKTFPNIANQLEFVTLGTAGFSRQPYGNPQRPGGPHAGNSFGNMPTFKGKLTETELLEVVRHERETLSGETDDFKIDPAGARLWPNGKPMLNSSGKLVWDDGEVMFDTDGKLTKSVDASKPAS
jgi:hypothetical protein